MFRLAGYINNAVMHSGQLIPYFTWDKTPAKLYLQELSDDNKSVVGFSELEIKDYPHNEIVKLENSRLRLKKGEKTIVVFKIDEEVFTGNYQEVAQQIFSKKKNNISPTIKEIFEEEFGFSMSEDLTAANMVSRIKERSHQYNNSDSTSGSKIKTTHTKTNRRPQNQKKPAEVSQAICSHSTI